jgi:hypothetical protein
MGRISKSSKTAKTYHASVQMSVSQCALSKYQQEQKTENLEVSPLGASGADVIDKEKGSALVVHQGC